MGEILIEGRNDILIKYYIWLKGEEMKDINVGNKK